MEKNVVRVLYVGTCCGGGKVEGDFLVGLANVSPMCSFTCPRNKELVNQSRVYD